MGWLENSRDDRNESRNIAWRILSPEYQGARNATNSSECSKRGTAKCSPPLTPNVVRLVRHGSRNAGIGACNAQKSAEITQSRVGSEPHNGKTNDGDASVENKNGGTHVPSITCPCRSKHEYSGEDIRRSSKTLGSGNAEPEIIAEDDGKEEGE